MKSPLQFSKTLKRQQGDFLVEALIGTLLTSLVAMGVMQVTSTVIRGQQEVVTQDVVVNQLRSVLQEHSSGTVDACATGQTIKEVQAGGVIANTQVSATKCESISTTYKMTASAPSKSFQAAQRIALTASGYSVGGYSSN